jgi:hypothetical protein
MAYPTNPTNICQPPYAVGLVRGQCEHCLAQEYLRCALNSPGLTLEKYQGIYRQHNLVTTFLRGLSQLPSFAEFTTFLSNSGLAEQSSITQTQLKSIGKTLKKLAHPLNIVIIRRVLLDSAHIKFTTHFLINYSTISTNTLWIYEDLHRFFIVQINQPYANLEQFLKNMRVKIRLLTQESAVKPFTSFATSRLPPVSVVPHQLWSPSPTDDASFLPDQGAASAMFIQPMQQADMRPSPLSRPPEHQHPAANDDATDDVSIMLVRHRCLHCPNDAITPEKLCANCLQMSTAGMSIVNSCAKCQRNPVLIYNTLCVACRKATLLKEYPEWTIGTASGAGYNCLIDSILQLFQEQLGLPLGLPYSGERVREIRQALHQIFTSLEPMTYLNATLHSEAIVLQILRDKTQITQCQVRVFFIDRNNNLAEEHSFVGSNARSPSAFRLYLFKETEGHFVPIFLPKSMPK